MKYTAIRTPRLNSFMPKTQCFAEITSYEKGYNVLQ